MRNGNTNKIPVPTGDLRQSNDNETLLTAPIPLPVVFTKVDGNLTLVDAKLWLLLLHLSWDDLSTKSKLGIWHEVEESELVSLFSQYSGAKDLEKLWEAGKRLAKTTVEYQKISENDDRWLGISALFSCEYKPKGKRSGVFRYMFPAPLVDIILDPKVYARLKLVYILNLKSKYTFFLYQILETVVNLKKPIFTATVEELRDWLKVPEKKHTEWGHFYNHTLKKALEEINMTSHESGIEAEHKLIRDGKGGKVRAVQFFVKKSNQRKVFEEELKTKYRHQISPSSCEKGKVDTSKSLPLENSDLDAVHIALYFYEKQYGTPPKQRDLNPKDIQEAKIIIGELKKIEIVKDFIDLVISSKNSPTFLSGIKYHKPIFYPPLRKKYKAKRQQKQVKQEAEKIKQKQEHQENLQRKEFMKYYEKLDKKEIDEIIKGIPLLDLERMIINKDSPAAEILRKDKVFKHWLQIKAND